MEPANVEKFLRVMQLGLQPRGPVPARDLMNREAVRRMIAEKGALVFSFVDFDRPLRHGDVFFAGEPFVWGVKSRSPEDRDRKSRD